MTTLGQFAAELSASQVRVQAVVQPVIARTAVEVKGRLQQEAYGHRHARDLPWSINYDMTNGGLGFECGPNKGGPGSLANLYYFGSSRMNAQLPDPVIALRDEADKAAIYMIAAVIGSLK